MICISNEIEFLINNQNNIDVLTTEAIRSRAERLSNEYSLSKHPHPSSLRIYLSNLPDNSFVYFPPILDEPDLEMLYQNITHLQYINKP